MLELLVKYARDHDLAVEPGFAPKDVRWAIVYDSKGRLLGVMELGDTSLGKKNRGQNFPKCPEMSQPEMKSGGVTKSHFLVDTTEVVAFYGQQVPTPKIKAKHDYFVNLLRQAGSAVPELLQTATLLEDSTALENIRAKLEANGARASDKVTLAVEGREPPFVVESADWHEWWRAFRAGLAREQGKAATMRCLVTGEVVQPCRTHPKIKGLSDVGGLATGDVLASYKQDSFCSYGLEQSANAAVSEDAAFAYRAALNHLIREHGERLAAAKVVHWFKKRIPAEDDPLSWVSQSTQQHELAAQERARELLDAIRSGKRPDLGDNFYYALTLSANSGRVVVRDWMEGQFEELLANVAAWFDDLSIVRRDGGGTAPAPKFLAVAGSLVRELGELPPPFLTKLWRVAIRREPIPSQALAQALARAKVDIIEDRPASHARMGLIKAYHIRKGDAQMKAYLNEDHPEPAYHCGRLMAVLAALQYSALGDVGAGVVQRFYAAASTTPALVLGRLTRNSQFHLNKLDTGLARWYENKIAQVVARIKDRFPKTLSLEQQSIFALGYYHQMAADRTKKNETPE